MAKSNLTPSGANEWSLYYPSELVPAGVLTKRICWSAVFAGTLVAIVTQQVLSLLGLGVGMGTLDPLEEQNPLSGLGT